MNRTHGKITSYLRKKVFELLQDILESAEELDTRAPYDKLVTTTFAEKAAK